MDEPIMNNENIIQKVWNLCNILRGDGLSYHEYISELTYLLFLKIAEDSEKENLLPEGYRWSDLVNYKDDNLLVHYQEMLTHLGGYAATKEVREIFAFPTTVFSHSVNLKAVIDGINKIDWHSVADDGIGQVYEGLLAKNSEDARSGAGQYFTPRALVNCIVEVMKPQLGETIQDPASGSGGFLISADHYVRSENDKSQYSSMSPVYQGMEIEKGTHRICLMNTFLHRMDAKIFLGDALTEDCRELAPADLILANPPFGAKAGSAREGRGDIPFQTTNKQFMFLQHIYLGLKAGGRAAVVLPDNVLFADGDGKSIRTDLMDKCNLHTILRLPTGIFYAQGVKTNVLFFTRGTAGNPEQNENCTESVWVYDLRTNMPSFGKRTPFSEKHLNPFEALYGGESNGTGLRSEGDWAFFAKDTEQITENSRWRCFCREYIRDQNDDSLDISWIKDENSIDAANLPDPEVLAVEAKGELTEALRELDGLMQALGLDGEAD
jgi:type I restriction enzyme M protein